LGDRSALLTAMRLAGLYAWNAQLSAAMMAPLHVCEVVVRNAVADALTAVFREREPIRKA